MLKDAVYGGVNAAVLTAMRDDLAVDPDRMAVHCKHLLANGCNGLGVLGTTGEANSIGIAERMELLESLLARGVPARRMLPGTGTTSVTDTVTITKHARDMGCPGALLLPPFYYKNPSDDGLFAYFSTVIERVGGGILFYLYNFPQQSAIPFSVDLFTRLLKRYPKVFKGVKDSSGSFENGKAYIESFAKDGFEVYAGDDTLLLPLLRLGGAGCITAAGNMNSALAAQVYAHWDGPAGETAAQTLAATRKAAVSVPLISGLKALKARETGEEAWQNIRPPHLRLTTEQQRALFAAWDATGIGLAQAA
jgi:4-hydroxy-tetrahydrodipicolinate synthase